MYAPAESGYEGTRADGSEAVRVWLLGGFQVSIGSRTITQDAWRLRKAAALVKLLALAPGHRIHREQAMDILWPDSEVRAASNSLRGALHAGRRTLAPDPRVGPRYLASRGETLVLCPEGQLWVDVEAFEEAAAMARRSQQPSAYRAAGQLYAGELLPDDRYEEWTENRREQLRRLYLELLIEATGLYEERREYEQAMEAFRWLLSEEPTNEEAHAGLMRLYALSGRQGEALAQYERLRGVLSRQLGTEPGLTTRTLRDEIAAGRFQPTQRAALPQEEPPHAGEHNLPSPRTSFVGREREMVEVKRKLAMTGLLTFIGAGGCGKTRLALEVARDLIGTYKDGIWLVELASLSGPGLVAQEVANVLGVRERPGETLLDSLAEALADKELLLVLDNCEHLIEAAARLADALLNSRRKLRILATSREPLGVGGEVLWRVPPLSLPDAYGGSSTVEDLMRYEAVRLFVDRVRQRLLDFEVTQDNAGTLARMCRKLDGMPLAIELATARMGALGMDQVAQRLEVSLDVLKGNSRSAAPRQQTLRATLDWSHDLLSEEERAMFRRLSGFAGGWTLEAAESVCPGDSIGQEDVLDLLAGLVDKSLVVIGANMGGVVRYRMLEPIRQYAREKLAESGEAERVQSRHAEFFLTLAEEAEPQLARSQQAEWLDRLETEHDNLRAALSWALERGIDHGPRMAGALGRFWHTRGYFSEGRGYLEAAARATAPATVRAKVLKGLGWIAEPQGDYELASAAYEECLELYRSSNNERGVANALGDMGSAALDRGDYEEAHSLLEESLMLHRELGSNEEIVGVLNGLGVLASANGDRERSISFFSEALALSRGTGNVRMNAVSLGNLGITLLVHGDSEQATVLLEEGLALFRDIGDSSNIAIGLMHLALAALIQGDHERVESLSQESLKLLQKAEDKQHIPDWLEIMAGAAGAQGQAQRAARLWGAAEAIREDLSVPLQPEDRQLLDPYLATARSSLGEGVWQTTLAEGRAMMPKQAIEYSLSAVEPALPQLFAPRSGGNSATLTPLTPREEEVSLLVSRGLTNRQIASELFISEHTVANHVAKILKKLALSSRSQLSAWIAAERWVPSSD